MSMEEIFTRIYRRNGWFQTETASGSGSTIFNTVALREELPMLIRELEIRSMVDIPCGDYHWMKDLDLGLDRYVGGDIVKEIVERNLLQVEDNRCQFFHLDITQTSLPLADLVLCRDCLVHFSFHDAQRAIDNIVRSQSKYLASTTFPGVKDNSEIATGDWRPINLQIAPFYFPEPIRLIKEHHIWHGEEHTDKSLGLWRIVDIPPQLKHS